MSASLVGSEMCIRDRPSWLCSAGHRCSPKESPCGFRSSGTGRLSALRAAGEPRAGSRPSSTCSACSPTCQAGACGCSPTTSCW
eukprot:8047844-Alexandrium_andersonii.AAC.1